MLAICSLSKMQPASKYEKRKLCGRLLLNYKKPYFVENLILSMKHESMADNFVSTKIAILSKKRLNNINFWVKIKIRINGGFNDQGHNNYSSSRQEVFCKKDVLKNFVKFIEKDLCQSSFFNKVTGLQLYLKRDSGTGVSLWILRNFL